jgi:hypothetical protein
MLSRRIRWGLLQTSYPSPACGAMKTLRRGLRGAVEGIFRNPRPQTRPRQIVNIDFSRTFIPTRIMVAFRRS